MSNFKIGPIKFLSLPPSSDFPILKMLVLMRIRMYILQKRAQASFVLFSRKKNKQNLCGMENAAIFMHSAKSRILCHSAFMQTNGILYELLHSISLKNCFSLLFYVDRTYLFSDKRNKNEWPWPRLKLFHYAIVKTIRVDFLINKIRCYLFL